MMNNCEEKKIEWIESIIEEKEFGSLSETERNLVIETLGSAEEFTRLKSLTAALSDPAGLREESPDPDPDILRNLTNAYFRNPVSKQVFKSGVNFLNRRIAVHAYQVGMMVVFFILIIVFRPKAVQYIDRPVAVSEIVHDTVRVRAIVDTVYIVKYLPGNKNYNVPDNGRLSGSIPVTESRTPENPEKYLSAVNRNVGFSLKDKAYLLNLSVNDE